MKTSAFSWNNLLYILSMRVVILSLVLTSCYHSEEYEPKEYLNTEIHLEIDGIEWKGINAVEATLNFQNNYFRFSASEINQVEVFACYVSGKDSALFNTYYSSYNEDLAEVIQELSYRSNDTLRVQFFYWDYSQGNGESTQSQWDGATPDYNELIIEEVFAHDGEAYLSGSFTAGVYRSYNDQLVPANRFYNGTFKNVRISKVYYQE